MTIENGIFVPGKPIPKGSKNAYVRGGRAVVVDAHKGLASWEQTIAAAVSHFPQIPGAVKVRAWFCMPRPLSHHVACKADRPIKDSMLLEHHTKKPDKDKLERALLDGLVKGGLIEDDAKVIDGAAAKVYCPPGIEPGVYVIVRGVSDDEATSFIDRGLGVLHDLAKELGEEA